MNMTLRKRRPVNKEWDDIFFMMRERTAKYGDEQLTLRTIEFFEALPDDKPADCIIALDILEHLPDPAAALIRINQLAKKTIIVHITPDKDRNENWWRKLIDKYLYCNEWLMDKGRITAVCQAGSKVHGVRPVGAGSDDGNWSNVEASLKRIKKRVGKAPAHDGKCIVACYGPSLQDNWERLKNERAEGNCIVVSMSGSHDFLIERGVIPDYHVDADPRAYKAKNIKLPNHAVKYYLASCCDPAFFDLLEGYDVSLWHVAVSDHLMKLIDTMGESKQSVVSGGGSVGLRAHSIFHGLGYRNFSTYGMDCSFSEDGHTSWAGAHMTPKPLELCKVQCGDVNYTTSPVFATYATQFFDMVRRFDDSKFHVWGEGLLQAMCRLSYAEKRLEVA